MVMLAAFLLVILLAAVAWLLGLCGGSGSTQPVGESAPERGGGAKKSGLAGKRQQRTEALLSSKEERFDSLRTKARARYKSLVGGRSPQATTPQDSGSN